MISGTARWEESYVSELYDYPEYYEIAFSFRDINAEVDLFEECFRRFSGIPVKSVLELGSGNSPHMGELVKRGYRYCGLDLNDAMLDYSREKARDLGVRINLIKGDMIDFNLKSRVDFVFVMLGSLFATSTSDLVKHFSSVSRVLRKGGLYLLDWCVQTEPPWQTKGGSNWEIERNGVRVKTTVTWKPVNIIKQIFEETIAFEVDDNGEKIEISGSDIRRAIYPQEFLRFISGLKTFEFIGWWNNWNLDQPLEKAIKVDRPITLVRRI
jgi:SAM-dependent methyltransferase